MTNCPLCGSLVRSYDDATPLTASVAAAFGLTLAAVGVPCHVECHGTAAQAVPVEARAS